MSAEVWYADSSALVKVVIAEPESKALTRWLVGKSRLAACDLVRVEVVRAVRASDPAVVPRAWQVIGELALIRLDGDLYERAAVLDPPSLRSLDAVHLASAQSIGSELAGVLTYDQRMIEGAEALGMSVASPGRR
jgi:predicted nucleic acid-binding protein